MMAPKARLHWFWRGAIAAVFGGICAAGANYAGYSRQVDPGIILFLRRMLPTIVAVVLSQIVKGLIPAIGALLADSLLTHWLARPVIDGEIRCRRCDHILRGLSKPRCPECGEAI